MTMEKIKVVADFDWLENEETIGLLGHESQRGTDVYTFEYDKDWLKRHPSLNLGKELQSFPGVQYNPTRNRIFGLLERSGGFLKNGCFSFQGHSYRCLHKL